MTLADEEALSIGETRRLIGTATEAVQQFHQENPLRRGMPRASLAGHVGLTLPLLEALIAAAPGLVDDGTVIRDEAFATRLDPADQERWEAARARLHEAGFAAPRCGDLGLGEELVHALTRNEDLTRVSDDLVYLPETLDDLTERTRALPDGFTVADFRDRMGITRKHAVPLLEWLDRSGITQRKGDQRTVRRS
jgi:selenocysteine-specific elongation factor